MKQPRFIGKELNNEMVVIRNNKETNFLLIGFSFSIFHF